MKKSQWHKPYRIKKKKSPLSFLKSRVLGLAFLIFIFIAGIFYLFLFFPKFQIKGVEISGVKTVSVENLQVLLENKTAHKILFLNSKSIFLTNSGAIKDVILKEFPQINKVSLKKKLPDHLTLTVEERMPIGIWCTGEGIECFNLDQEGIIFSENQETAVGTLKITDFTKKENPTLGGKAINKTLLDSIKNIEAQLKNINIEPLEFILVQADRLNVKTVSGFEIYFNLADDLKWQITELNQVLENEIPLQKRGKLEYIDLRFSKVYYKYQ